MRDRGFSIVELLVVLGIISLILGLLLPVLRGGRDSARRVSNLSNIRQLGQAIWRYEEENRSLPAVFKPELASHQLGLQTVEFQGRTIQGGWFTNGNAFAMLLPNVPPETFVDPSRRGDMDWISRGSDYALSDSYYAHIDYWDPLTQAGPEQWDILRIDDAAFPSDKGLMRQMMVYDVPGHESGFMSCCVDAVRSAVLWADMSASVEVQSQLRLGVHNAYTFDTYDNPAPFWQKGPPIDGTKDGVAGRDKP